MLTACRNDEANRKLLDAFVYGLGIESPARLDVRQLDEQAVGRLIAIYLGADKVDPKITGQVVIRSSGNPFAVGEYLRAMLDNGLLRPYWGSWLLDPSGFGSLTLPDDVIQLVISRIGFLGPEAKNIITTAAVIDHRFHADILQNACDYENNLVRQTLIEAVGVRILEPAEKNEFSFVHDRIREAMLSTLEPDDLAALHRRIAAALENSAGEEKELIYSLARHYYLGGGGENPEATYKANFRAGLTAIQDYAYEQAHTFLQQAHEIATARGILPEAEFYQAAGEADSLTGRIGQAQIYFDKALTRTDSPGRRAAIRFSRAKIMLGQMDTDAARAELRKALAELGRRAQTTGVFQIAATMGQWLFHLLIDLCRSAQYPKDSEEYETNRLLTHLYNYCGMTAYYEIDPLSFILNTLRARNTAQRLGPSRELTEWYISAGIIAAVIRKNSLALSLCDKSFMVSEQVGDPATTARYSLFRAIVDHFIGLTNKAEAGVGQALERYGRWLENVDYLAGCADIAWNLLMRGHAREGWRWIELGLQRVEAATIKSNLTQGHSFRCYAGPLLALLGRPGEGIEHLREIHDLMAPQPKDRWRWAQYIAHSALYFTLIDDLGPELDELFAMHDKLGLSPKRTPLHLRQFYIAKAYAFLRRYEQATPAARRTARRHYHRALAQLKKTTAHPTVKCHRLVIEARGSSLEGDQQKSQKLLVKAEELAKTTDNVWVIFEIACQRGRNFLSQGNTAAARREFRDAHRLALEHGWVLRARLLHSEFNLDIHSPSSISDESRPHALSSLEPGTLHLRRCLNSLLQVNQASATVFAPNELAKVALDEIVRILGGERAFLFLLDEDGKTLNLQAGRDAAGQEISHRDDYSRTVLNQVCRTRKPLVVNRTDQGEISAADSIVFHDLRSILAAPLLMRQNFIGVVYLDSRLAKGLFTEDDVEILLAIANHIAIALETSKAAQLKVEIEAERVQRRLAEQLRLVGGALNSSLDLQEVLRHFLDSLTMLVPNDRAVLLLLEHDYLRVAASRGMEEINDMRLQVTDHPIFNDLMQNRAPILVNRKENPTAVHYLGGHDVNSWLVVPLIVRDEVIGVLGLDSRPPATLSKKHADLMYAIAGQAATSIENARLFGKMQRQAITDSLTGIYNRGHFITLAERELMRSRRYQRPLSVLMADIDHFKKVNDSFGHATGDQVLCQVAGRLQESIRGIDILGRYGGEEFALFLADTDGAGAMILAERLRSVIADRPVATDSGDIKVTISIGLSSADKEYSALEIFLNHADQALYSAKNAGRNRVKLFS